MKQTLALTFGRGSNKEPIASSTTRRNVHDTRPVTYSASATHRNNMTTHYTTTGQTELL